MKDDRQLLERLLQRDGRALRYASRRLRGDRPRSFRGGGRLIGDGNKSDRSKWSFNGAICKWPRKKWNIMEWRGVNYFTPGFMRSYCTLYLSGWFQIFFIFTLTWGNDPI